MGRAKTITETTEASKVYTSIKGKPQQQLKEIRISNLRAKKMLP